MTGELTFVMTVALLGGAFMLIVATRVIDQARRDAARVCIAIVLPRLKPAQVSFAQQLLTPPASALTKARTTTVFEAVADGPRVGNQLRVPGGRGKEVVAQLRTALGSVAIEETESPSEERFDVAVELGLRQRGAADLGADDVAALSGAALTALSGLRRGERGAVQTIPLGRGQRTCDSRTTWQRLMGSPQTAQDKRVDDVVGYVVRIGASAQDRPRAHAIVRRIERAFRPLNRPGAVLVRRPLPSWVVARRMARGTTPATATGVWTSPDNEPVFALWPIGERLLVSGYQIGGSPQRPVDPTLPRRGRVIGRSDADGKLIAAPLAGAAEHAVTLGPTGSGKTVLTSSLFLHDVNAGYGGVFLSVKRQNAENVLARLTDEAIARTVVVAPLDRSRPVTMPINVVAEGGLVETGARQLLDLIESENAADIGPRSKELLGATAAALRPGESLISVLRAWTDPGFMAELAARSAGNPIASSYWNWLAGLSDETRAAYTAAPANKIRPILASEIARNALAAPRASFTMSQAMRENLIVVFDLDEGRLGRWLTSVFGKVAISQVWAAVQTRRSKRFFHVLIDEAPRFIAGGTSELGDIFARAREFGVGLSVVGQAYSQFGATLGDLILNSARSKYVFSTSAADARRLAPEFGFGVEAEHLTSLERFHVLAKVSVGGAVSRPFTMATEPLPPATSGRAAEIRRASRERWGIPVEEITASFSWDDTKPSGSLKVGRRRS